MQSQVISMSATQSTSGRTVVEVNPLGLLNNDRYVGDLDALAAKAAGQIQAMSSTLGQIDMVAVRQSYQLCQALEERFSEHSAMPDVEYHSLDFRQMLDDESEPNADVAGVRLTAAEKAAKRDGASTGAFENDPAIASLVASQDLSDDVIAEMHSARQQIDDTFTVPLAEFDVETHFDLRIREHKEAIPMAEVSQNRINRAKAKALAKQSERLQNDWYDTTPTVDGVVVLSDGTDRGQTRLDALDGENPFVKYPETHDGEVLEVNCKHDGIIDWTRYLLETDEITPGELSDSQRERLDEQYGSEALDAMGLSANPAPKSTRRNPAAEAAAVAGQGDD